MSLNLSKDQPLLTDHSSIVLNVHRSGSLKSQSANASTNHGVPTDASNYNTVLHPFAHQVGGHTQLMLLDQSTVCKPLIQRELLFYLKIPPELAPFVPKYKGVVHVRQADGCPILYHPIRGFKQSTSSSKSSIEDQLQHEKQSGHIKLSQSQPELRVQISTCNDQRLVGQHDLLNSSSSSDTCSAPATSHTEYGYSSKPSQRYFLLLENIASRFHLPCILDLKMGTRQHGDDASDAKRQRQMAKCAATTSARLGVRLCGMQIYDPDMDVYVSKDKYYGRKLDEKGLRAALRQFFYSGSTFAIDSVLKKLNDLKEAVEQQKSFRFYSTSLLIAYEGCTNRTQHHHDNFPRANPNVEVRMIDFAHTILATSRDASPVPEPADDQDLLSTNTGAVNRNNTIHEGPDKGFLQGLNSLIKLLSDVREEGYDQKSEDDNPDSEYDELFN